MEKNVHSIYLLRKPKKIHKLNIHLIWFMTYVYDSCLNKKNKILYAFKMSQLYGSE